MPAGPSGNLLLRTLAAWRPAVFHELERRLTPVVFPAGTTLNPLDELPPAVYFIDEGVASLVGHTVAGDTLELSSVGREGMTSLVALLGGSPPPYTFVAQLPLIARRMTLSDARETLLDGRWPNGVIAAYAELLIAQISHAALCARFHTATERVSRWALVMGLKHGGEELPVTHEALSRLLGVPRSQVTDALGTLREAGAIDARRGHLAILNHAALRVLACECYESERERLSAFEQTLSGWTAPETAPGARPRLT